MRIPAGLYEGFYMSITTVALLHGGEPPREGGLQRGEGERAGYRYLTITRGIRPLGDERQRYADMEGLRVRHGPRGGLHRKGGTGLIDPPGAAGADAVDR